MDSGESHNTKGREEIMEKKCGRLFFIGGSLLATFALWTVLVRFVDVQAIGPEGSSVGFAVLNGFVHELIGVNWFLYTVTDWLGLVPIAVVFGFAVFGFMQWIKRKKLFQVDPSLLILGGFYLVVMAVYILFEMVVINYRPTLIDGSLEASYPSSTTMLVTCVMPTAMMQLAARMKNGVFKRCVMAVIVAFIAFMVIGRLVSGVHWITDMIGGALFSAGVVVLYRAVIRFCNHKFTKM